MTHRPGYARVLVVHDGPDRDALERVLRARELVLRVASDARQALTMAEEEAPDVLLIDTGMSGGHELICALRARDVPVIAVAAMPVMDAAELVAVRQAAAAYLTCPLDRDALLIAIDRAIETRGLRREAVSLRARAEQLASEAQRKLRMQQELFATVAHDVRSHLAAVTMVMVSLARNALPGQERKVVLMRRAVERVESLVDDLLDLVRLEAGTLQLPFALERAAPIVGDVVARSQSAATARGVTVVANVDGDFALCCDRDRIARALEHLVAIALRMTPRDGIVRVRADVREGRGRFAVESDAAKGRGHDVPLEKSLDLGVAIAKAIIDAHGGNLESSRGGTKIEVALPLAPEAISAASIVAGQEITATSS